IVFIYKKYRTKRRILERHYTFWLPPESEVNNLAEWLHNYSLRSPKARLIRASVEKALFH
ncbi:hypothetical protein EAO91_19975, partial [Salmonella enterica]|nr:hypothetical protein [Salmonella enterica]